LAESDRKATKRYGIDPATIKRPEIPAETPVEKPKGAASVIKPYDDAEKEKRYQDFKKSQEKKP
jgi:3-hydroxy-3-methylglutaryl CoA synthase